MQKTTKHIAHIILAAGSSSRMGTPKQLLAWKNDTLIAYEIKKSLKIEPLETFVVLGAHCKRIQKEIINFPIKSLYHKNWELGMGSSISYGIQHILEEVTNFDGVLISLVDQPLIDEEHIRSLISEFHIHTNKIVATEMKERIGVPAIFPPSCFSALRDLTEDYGARHIIKNYKDQVIVVSGKDKTKDIDTLVQYRALLKSLED